MYRDMCRVVSYRIVSYRIVSYRIVSYRIVSYRIVSYRIVSYRIVSCASRCVSYCVLCNRDTCRIISYRVLCIAIRYHSQRLTCVQLCTIVNVESFNVVQTAQLQGVRNYYTARSQDIVCAMCMHAFVRATA